MGSPGKVTGTLQLLEYVLNLPMCLYDITRTMRYKVEFKYRYGKDYVYCNEYHEDEQFVQPLNSNGKPLCTIAKTNIQKASAVKTGNNLYYNIKTLRCRLTVIHYEKV